nr:DUF935 domain-containing protein [Moritella viscosa]SHN99477.1 Putative uncharacterized protein [Moritella viscosa]
MSVIINPATNRPFNSAEQQALTQQQSRAYTTGVRTPASTKSIAKGLTPSKLASLLKKAATGSAEDYFILAEEMEERDLHYRSVLSTRKLAVASLDFSVEAASDEPQHIEQAQAVRELLRHPQMPDAGFDLLDGLGKGIGLVEIIWDTSNTPWVPQDYQWVDPRFIVLDDETLSELHLKSDDNPKGEPLKQHGYIVHMPRMKSGHWLRNGLARLVSVMYMLKSYTVRDWWAFAEIFGMPIRVGKYHANASEADIRTLVNAISTIASDAGAAIPESMKIDMIESGKGNGGDTLFENMAEWADRQISKAVLGQTMTTDDGASQSQATVHNEVRKDIIRWDARQLANALNRYLVRAFIDINYGVQTRYPTIELIVEEPQDTKAWVDALTPLIDRGLKVQSSEVPDKLGISDPDDDSDVLVPLNTPSTEPSSENTVALNRKLALNSSQTTFNRDDEVAQLTQNALDEWEEISAPILNPILDLAQSTDSFEAFSAQLPTLAEGLSADEFVEQLASLCWQARALGDTDDA